MPVAAGPALLAVDDRREWAARRVDETIVFAKAFASLQVLAQLGNPICAWLTRQYAASCEVILQRVWREL